MLNLRAQGLGGGALSNSEMGACTHRRCIQFQYGLGIATPPCLLLGSAPLGVVGPAGLAGPDSGIRHPQVEVARPPFGDLLAKAGRRP